jgi:hypothetical protein
MRGNGPEAHDRKPKEKAADSRHRQEFRPHHVETCAAVKDRLCERHEMRVDSGTPSEWERKSAISVVTICCT